MCQRDVEECVLEHGLEQRHHQCAGELCGILHVTPRESAPAEYHGTGEEKADAREENFRRHIVRRHVPHGVAGFDNGIAAAP